MAEIDATQAVVSANETYEGVIRPAEQADLGRQVRIKEGSVVDGDVYGDEVTVGPDARVEGSVLAASSVDLDGGTVTGDLGSGGRVAIDDGAVGGTVSGVRVVAEEAAIRGNLVGTEAIVDSSVVLGLAGGDRQIELTDSLTYTVDVDGEATFDSLTVVLPQAIVNGPVTFETPVRVAGLGDLGVETADERHPQMDERDLYEGEDNRYLTLAPRILRLDRVADRLDELEAAVMETITDTPADPETAVEAVLDALDVDPEFAG